MIFNKNSLIVLLCVSSFSSVILGYGRYYGIATNQNKRPYQEDRYMVISNLEFGGDFFGIYDGHGGAETATFLQNHLDRIFVDFLRKGYQKGYYWSTPCYILDTVLWVMDQFAMSHFTDGSTASVVYIDEYNTLYCAWVGDSRVVVEKNGAVHFATRDHKPNDPQELDRIQKYGGTIEKIGGVWRVGGLALSRSIGDAFIKKNYPVQAIPECEEIALDNTNHFLIMASDGLWDVVSSEEAVTFVKEQLAHINRPDFESSYRLKFNFDLHDIANNLKNMAIERGSGDNITICIVYFDWSGDSFISRIKRFWNSLRAPSIRLAYARP